MPHEKPRSVQLEFSYDVPADTPTNDPDQILREVPFDGFTTVITVGWPDGTDNGVGVGLYRNAGANIFPWDKENQFVAANDFTHAFDLVVPVSEGEELEARYANNDTSNSHFVNAIVTVVEHENPQEVSIVEDRTTTQEEYPPGRDGDMAINDRRG